jgi:hypothetical protein
LARQLVALLPEDLPIVLAGENMVVAHPGPHAFGKARHREPVRSSHAFTAWRYGHKWVALAVLICFPFADRPWALPILVALCQSEEADPDQGRRHCTPAQHMELPACRRVGSIEWPGKSRVTFSDALTGVRRWLWAEGFRGRVEGGCTFRDFEHSRR